ncbi:MAG: cation:proton antiporter [Eubacterium sp.]|nr:cation:proton antiporter [Candidatus Colimonas fimequi]
MELESLVLDLALIMSVAAIVTLIFKKIKQPVVLGYIVAGFLISPNFEYLPTVVDSADITVWADIGVIFFMFGLGLEFSFKKLATVGGSAFVIAITVIGSMIFIGTGLGSLLGWAKMDCIFLGCMLSMSSTMIILKAYEEFGVKQEKYAQIVLGTLVIEDIAGIFMMIVLAAVSVGQNVSGLELVNELGMLLIYLAIWLMLGIYLIPSFLNKATKIMSDEMLLIFSIGLCLVMVVIANLIGFSSALGAFMTGSILAGTIHGARIERIITPIKDMFGAIFFVSVGMLIVPSLLIEYLGPIIIITLVTIIGQSIFSSIGILLSGQDLHTAIKGGSSMVQIGEFSFILATLGTSLGVISGHLYPVVVCVSVITSFTTPVMMKNADNVYGFVMKILPRRAKIFLRKMTSEKQDVDDKDTDWFDYILAVLARTGICSSMMFIIYFAGTRYMSPFLIEYGKSWYWGTVASAVIMILLMIPFMRLMHGSTKDALYTKLWLKHRANRLPLLTLKAMRIFVAACFMAMVVRHLFHIPFALLVVIAAIPVLIFIRSDFVKGRAIDIEMKFMSNFAQKTLVSEKKARGTRGNLRMVNESLYVAEFEVKTLPEEATVIDLTGRRGFHVTIIKIVHDNGEIVNLPRADSVIRSHDKLHMMGTEEEVEAIMLLLAKEDKIEYTDRPDMVLKDYIYGQTFRHIEADKQIFCIPIKVSSEMEFCRKAIKNCGLREIYRGTIIGIERGHLPIISPDIETVIQEDDLIWILGTKGTADKLIKAGFLEPPKKHISQTH